MTQYIRRQFMTFWNIFKDDNDINEKSVVGFISFAIMVLYALISVVGNLMGYDIIINETIYNSFVTVTLGSFGIATIGQAVNDYSQGRRGGFHDDYNGGGYGSSYKRKPRVDKFDDDSESEFEQQMKRKQ